MKEQVKLKFIEGLRSGDYTQRTGALRMNDSHCVLGVLCDLAVKEGVTEWHKESGAPSPAVLEWADLPARTVDFFIELNDGGALEFTDFADILEQDDWERILEEKFDEFYSESDDWDWSENEEDEEDDDV